MHDKRPPGRPPKSPEERRTDSVRVRLTPAEWTTLESRRRPGETQAGLVRRLALDSATGAERRAGYSHALLAVVVWLERLAADMDERGDVGLGDLLRQLARTLCGDLARPDEGEEGGCATP